ncbi:MAG: helix-turn-helix transcriptional regulator [Clostridia bacterium]|nr:helix-turn-helix transcriptional regulator [Clostridia bacterium]
MEEKKEVAAMTRSRFPDGFRILKGKQEYVTYIEHSSLRVWYSETSWRYEPHCHSAVEIIMPIRGEVTYNLGEEDYRVQADEVLIVPPEWMHGLSMEAGSARYLFLFEPANLFSMRDMSLIKEVLRKPIYLRDRPGAQQSIRGLLAQVVENYEKRDFLWNSMCYSYLLQMYVQLGRLYTPADQRRSSDGPNRVDPEIIDSARLFIDQNYMRPITLADVSAYTGFSECYFSRTFKQQTGQSFSEYLRIKRVAMAAEMLIHSRHSIQKIASSAGFGSVATFNRVFRTAKNCTPSRYREIYGDFLKE